MEVCIGCPRIIRTCNFPQVSLLRWNRWRCGYQNFMKYSSKGKAKCHTLQKSPHDPIQSLFPVRAEELLFPFCPSTKQANIDKGRNPRLHNRAIGIKFAGDHVKKCETSWISVAPKYSSSWGGQSRKVASSASSDGTENHARSGRHEGASDSGWKVLPKTCKLTNNQT